MSGTRADVRLACPVCWEAVCVSLHGRIRAHRTGPERLHCSGSGRQVPTVLITTEKA